MMNTNQYPGSHTNSEENSSLFGLNVDAASNIALKSAASWARITGITGMIIGGLLTLWMIIGLMMAETVRSSGSSSPFTDMFMEEGSKIGAIIMIIAGAVFIVSGYLAVKFSGFIKAALYSNDQETLSKGFIALKNYFTLRAVAMIIVLLLFILSFLASMDSNS